MRDDQIRLADLQEQIDYIEQDVQLGHEAFIKDRHLQDSLALRIGYIGEALSKMSKDFKEWHPEIPWAKAASMRAKLFTIILKLTLKLFGKQPQKIFRCFKKLYVG